MFPRVKSSLIGALGSLVTVVLVYHVLKLSVTESYTRYLDTTEFTNYTLLESLLLPGTDYKNLFIYIHTKPFHFF